MHSNGEDEDEDNKGASGGESSQLTCCMHKHCTSAASHSDPSSVAALHASQSKHKIRMREEGKRVTGRPGMREGAREEGR